MQQSLPFDTKCPAYRVAKALQEVAQKELDIEIFLVDLLAASLKLGDSHLGISIWQFAQRNLTGDADQSAIRYAALSSSIVNPEDLWDEEVARGAKLLAHETGRDRPSLQMLLCEKRSVNVVVSIPYNLELHFRMIALAKAALKDGRANEALDHLAPLLAEDPKSSRIRSFLADQVALLEFEALRALKNLDAAALSVVRNFVSNSNSLRHVPFEELLRGGGSRNLSKNPCLPILVYLNNGDEQDIYEAVDDFLVASNLSDPLGLLAIVDTYSLPVTRTLLRDVLKMPVLMRGALWANSPQELRQMRTELLRKLFSISIDDQAFVVNELAEVEHAKLLEDAYRNVEGAKFSLDFAEHNRFMAGLFEGAFERYLSYRTYEEKGGQLAVESELLAQATDGQDVKESAERKTETSEVLLSNLATAILAEYAWNSEKGVNATLGTRIRHGSLENQLKRIFDAQHLLATKDLSGTYRCDKHILNVVETCADDEGEILQEAYVAFTAEVNGIYQRLLTRLRIRVGSPMIAFLGEVGTAKELASDDGLLDLRELFSESTGSLIKKAQPKSVSAMIAEVNKVFAAAFSNALEQVRIHLRTQVAGEINAAITKLDDVVAGTLSDGWQRTQLRGDILAAKDGITNDLKIIQTWFSLVGRIDSGISSMRKLFDTAGRVVQFASNGKLGKLQTDAVDDKPISPEEGMILYEVLSIILRNVVQHSNMTTNQHVCCRYETTAEGKRRITVTNLVVDNDYCRQVVQRAKERLNAPRDPRVLERSPGGTGLWRIHALLKQISLNPIEVLPSVGSRTNEFSVQIIF